MEGGVAWLVDRVQVATIFNQQLDELRNTLGAGLVQLSSVPTVNHIDRGVGFQEGLGTLRFACGSSGDAASEKMKGKRERRNKTNKPLTAASYSAVRLFLSRKVALEPYFSSS